MRRLTTEEFIETIILKENLKDRNSVVNIIRGKYGGTWMHPYLFVKFAMWLDPNFMLMGIKLYDDRNKTLYSAKN